MSIGEKLKWNFWFSVILAVSLGVHASLLRTKYVTSIDFIFVSVVFAITVGFFVDKFICKMGD